MRLIRSTLQHLRPLRMFGTGPVRESLTQIGIQHLDYHFSLGLTTQASLRLFCQKCRNNLPGSPDHMLLSLRQ